MTTRTDRNEGANAEIIGVVILIGMFAIMAGILSATVFATPQPAKVPAASIEITQASYTSIRIAHLGGDPLPLDHLVLRGVDGGTPQAPMSGSALGTWLQLGSASALGNGYSKEITTPFDAVVLSWQGDTGESLIASWDPNGIYGPLGSSVPSGGPLLPYPTRTQPPMPTATTNWSSSYALDADFSIATPEPFYAGSTIMFTDTSTGLITDWNWTFGDGNTSTVRSPAYPYNHGEKYYVSLTVSNRTTGASDTEVKSVDVLPGTAGGPFSFELISRETVGIRELTVLCEDRNEFSQTIWQWTFTDGQTGQVSQTKKLTEREGRHVEHTFYNTGPGNSTCYIDLTVWSPYVFNPIIFETLEVTVVPPLRADFEPTPLIGVSPQVVQFLDRSDGLPEEWYWDFGDGNTSTLQNPTNIYKVPENEVKTFLVNLTVDREDSEPDSTTKEITIWPPVSARFTSNVTQGEAGQVVRFTDASTGSPSTWNWNFGDESIDNTSTEQNPNHTFWEWGTYDVSLKAVRESDPDSADEKTIPIYIRIGPEVFVDFNATPLIGLQPLEVQFNDNTTSDIPILAWYWNFGDGTWFNTTNPMAGTKQTHTYTSAGTYTVSLTAENEYRIATLYRLNYITVDLPPAAAFNATPGTTPLVVNFTDLSTGKPDTWSWEFSDGAWFNTTDPAAGSPTHTYAVPGNYIVNLSVWTTTRPDIPPSTASATVTAYGIPDASFTVDPVSPTAGEWVTFTNTSSGNPTAWLWNFGDGRTADGQGIQQLSYTLAGTFNVTLTVSNPAGSDTAWQNVTIEAPVTTEATTEVTTAPT